MRKNKTLAVWICLAGGALGLHRPYLYRRFDGIAWLQLIPTLIGAYGIMRARDIGLDDHTSWVLIPWIGLSVAASSLTAIVYGLMDAEKWNGKFNPGLEPQAKPGASGWLTVLGLIVALFMGATVLLSSIAFSFQRYFEYQQEEAQATSLVTDFRKSAS